MDDNESYLVTGYEVTRDGSVYTAAHKVNDGEVLSLQFPVGTTIIETGVFTIFIKEVCVL